MALRFRTLAHALVFAAVASTALPAVTLAAATEATAPATPAAKRPVTHEDIWLMKRVGPPSVSPDGRWAVFSLTEPAYVRREQRSDLWIVPTAGGTPARRLTATAAPESNVTWSEDSTRIAFVSRRENDAESQVYVLDIAGGGEAQRVTDAPLGARTPRFSPDGTRILYVADAWPGAKDAADNRRLDKERKERKHVAHAYEGFPIRHWDRWLDERQARLYVQALDGGQPKDVLAGSALIREPGYSGDRDNDGLKLDPAWTPDGRGIVFVASIDRDRAAFDFTSTQLWLVDADGGEPRRLTAGRDSWNQPRFAADGRTLYAERTPRTEQVYNATHLAALAWDAGAVPAEGAGAGGGAGQWRVLTAGLDRSVSAWGATADGTVYFLAEDEGHEKLYVLRRGGEPRLAFPMDAGAYTSLAVATRAPKPVLVARWESAVSPAEVVRLDPTRGHSPLTAFNAAKRAELAWEPLEHFWFTAPNGRRVHNLLVRPPGYDPQRKYPLLVLMHGGPHIMWRDHFFLRWNYHLIAQPGYVVLLTNYSGSTGFGETFARHIQGDPLAGPAEEINAAADEAIRRYAFIDGSRQCAAGASYGGHLANWMQATTTRYRCLVSHAGLLDLRSQWATSDSVYHREVNVGGPPWADAPLWRMQSPLTYAEKFRTPTLVTSGEKDFRVPVNNQLEYWTVLQRLQIPSRFVVFPTENHWVLDGENSRYFYRELHDWLARWLKADDAAD